MTGNLSYKGLARCRRGIHNPSTSQVGLDGGEVTTMCDDCGAQLSTRVDSWDAVFDEADLCGVCGEAPPYCKCEENSHAASA